MSAIPPGFLGSLAQTGVQAHQTASDRDADENRKVEAARSARVAADQRTASVSDTGEDTGIADGTTGTGGQGRAFGDGDAEQEQQDRSKADQDGIRRDKDGNLHLDIQA